MPTIKLSQFPGFIDVMNRRGEAAARRGLGNAALRGVQTIIAIIIPARSPEPVDRGTYRAGWRAEPVDQNTWLIRNSAPHAPIVEFGARAENIKPGRAMIAALAGWVQRKGIADANNAEGVAWAIAKAMMRKGIFGGTGLRILEELEQQYLPKIVEEEVREELRREFN